MLMYYGVYAPPPLEPVVSPNGDGVAETQQKLSYKVVRPSTVTVDAHRAGRHDRVRRRRARASRAPTTVAFPPAPPPPEAPPPPPSPLRRPRAAGRSRSTATDDQGLTSDDDAGVRRQLDARLSGVAPARVVVRPAGGQADDLRWSQARAARVKVTIETPEGVVVAHRRDATAPAGPAGRWPGTASAATASRSPAGATSSRVTATNELGVVALTQPLTVSSAPRG